MTTGPTIRTAQARGPGIHLTLLLGLGSLTGIVGCNPTSEGSAWQAGEAMPGHNRPVLVHDWPHPTALSLPEVGFIPPDPTTAEFETAGGLRAFILPDPEDPVVAITAAVASTRSPESREEGNTGERPALVRSLQESLGERLGTVVGQVGVGEEGGVVTVRVEVPTRHWRIAIESVLAALREPHPHATEGPTLPPEPAGGGMGRAVAELARTHARGVSPDTPTGPAPATAMGALTPAEVVIGIGGGVERRDVESALETFTEGWEGSPPAPSMAAAPPEAEGSTPDPELLRLVEHPGFMAWLALGHPMDPVAPVDEAAVAVMEEVLNIRLNIATREMRGLTNRALLVLPDRYGGGGLLHVRSSGRFESVGPILRYSWEELTRMREESGAPTAEEMSQAQGGLVLSRWQGVLDGPRAAAETYAVELARHDSLDRLLAWPEAVLAVDPSDVTAVAAAYLQPERLTAVVVGPIEEVREARHPQWPFALDEVAELLEGARARQ
ncbi:MAG: hypothetical protein WD960_02515 [Gemmatimonadota bacterium]